MNRMAKPSRSDDVKKGLPEETCARASRDDGGHEIGGGAGGAFVKPANWMEGEFHDASQAKSGLINPDRGEQHFSHDESNYQPHTDRSYRANAWQPASDAHDGAVCDMPYATG